MPLHCEISGSGPPITLLHGFTTHGAAWESVRHELAERFRVMTIDLPGHGRSAVPPPEYDFTHCAADVAAAMRANDQAPGVLLGYSMGGRIALATALQSPQSVAHLILESASPGIEDPAERATRRDTDAALADQIEAQPLADFIDGWLDLPLFRTQRSLDDAVRQRSRALRLANDPRALAASLRRLGTGSQPSFWRRLGELRMPVLLLSGELDEKFRNIASEMQQRLPNATSRVVAGAGHTIHLERPRDFLEHVIKAADRPPPATKLSGTA